jgi:hypothetical protein
MRARARAMTHGEEVPSACGQSLVACGPEPMGSVNERRSYGPGELACGSRRHVPPLLVGEHSVWMGRRLTQFEPNGPSTEWFFGSGTRCCRSAISRRLAGRGGATRVRLA